MKTLTKTALLMYLFCLAYSPATAQINLVPNPSFEEYDSCAYFITYFYARNWINPTTATPDYHQANCNNSFSGVPNNFIGFQNARTGLGYAGFLTSDLRPQSTDYREYIQCKFLKKMERGKKYIVTFFVSLADKSQKACDNIGAYISSVAPHSFDNLNLYVTPQVVSTHFSPIADTTNWIEISGVYESNGDEEFLTIGVFSKNTSTDWIYVDSSADYYEPYYYVDDVSVVEIDEEPFKMPTAFTPNLDGNNDLYYPVYFDRKLKIKDFRIYNGWGEIVYNDPSKPWDGTFMGKPQPPNIYTYYIFADIPLPDILDSFKTYRKIGAFILIR